MSKKERSAREDAVRESEKVHIVFTMDNSSYMRWQSDLLFFSAQHVEQRGPITAIFSGCDPEQERHIKERHARLGLPEQYRVHFVPKFNDNISHVINKPLGVHAWFRGVGTDRDVVAVVDADFVFVRPLTPKIEKGPQVLGWPHGAPSKMRPGLVVGQRWNIFFSEHPHDGQEEFNPYVDHPFKNMTKTELRTWICAGSVDAKSGCTSMTRQEVALYHDSGPPMLATTRDWDEWLVDSWKDITVRLHKVYYGYYVDMWSWMLANIHRNARELVVNNYQIGIPRGWEPSEPWKVVNETMATVDPCTDPMEKVLANPRLPVFIHYTYYTEAWNKRWFSSKPPQVFERCNATETNAGILKNLIGTHVNKSGMRLGEAFTTCVMRRFFAAGIRRACAGQPTASLLEPVAGGFKL